MHEIYHDIELEDWDRPKRSPMLLRIFESLLPVLIAPIAVFMMAIAIGILLEGKTPFMIISFLGLPLGLFMILPFWITLIIPAIFFNFFHFVNRFFMLLRLPGFDGSQVLLIPAVFVSKIVYLSLRHGNLSYRTRLSILIASCAVILIDSIIIVHYAVRSNLLWQVLIVYALEFFLFISITLNDYSRVGRQRRGNRRRVRNGRK